ncbi:MAG: PEP-CTERM system TPR-repeat protein PrsT [Burkholderiales bacterium]|nr:PEP-CTERM system TPR-repeat protein PrsT [Burkholderiales bacterium]
MTSPNRGHAHQWRWLMALGLLALIAAGLVATYLLRTSESGMLSSASRRLETGDQLGAVIELKSLLSAKPESTQGRLLLGKALLATGDPLGAEAELQRALTAGADADAVSPILAAALLARQNNDGVVLQFGQSTLKTPAAAAELKTYVGLALANLGRMDQAREAVAAALVILPNYAPAMLLQGQLLAGQGDPAAAGRLADAVIATEPSNAQAWLLKADLLRQGQAERAAVIAAYRKALGLRADLLPAHAALLTLLISQRDLDEAGRQWAQMSAALPDHGQTLYFEALLAYLKNDNRRAREITQILLQRAPDQAQLQMLAALVELRLNAPRQAETLLNKVVAAQPNAPGPRIQLAVAQQRVGMAAKASATLQPLLDGPRPNVEALMTAGRFELDRGEFAAADAYFTKALKLQPNDAELRTAQALAQFQRGNAGSALEDLTSIAAADKDGDVADLALISARMRRAEWAQALKAVAQLAVKRPASPLPAYLRGYIARQQRDAVGARAAFEQALAKDASHFPSVASLAALDLAAGQPAAALARFEALVKRDPRHSRAMLAAAEVLSRQPDQAEAMARWLDRAVKLNPSDASTQVAAIDLWLRARDAKRALIAAQAAVAQLPQDADVLDRLGLAQMAGGDLNQAIVTYTKLIGLRPQSALAEMRLAEAYRLASKGGLAEPHAERAAELATGLQRDERDKVVRALRDKQAEPALAIARKLQARLPNEAFGHLLEGDIHARLKQWPGAVAAFRKALAKRNPGDAPVRLHFALASSGQMKEAEAWARQWLAEHPADAGFWLHWGDAAVLANDIAQAELRYRRVLELRPESPMALNNLAYLLIKQGKPGALPLAERAVKAAPNRADIIDTLALALATEKQLDKAIEWQRKAVELAPKAGAMRLNLARFYLQAGDKPKAIEQLDQLAALGERFSARDEVARLRKEAGG